MLDEIIIILSTFQPLSIANFALCKKNRGLFMAKFSTTVVLSRQNPVDWRSLWQEFPNTVQILVGLGLSYEAKIIYVAFGFLAHYHALSHLICNHFSRKCRKVVLEKWFFKLGFFFGQQLFSNQKKIQV